MGIVGDTLFARSLIISLLTIVHYLGSKLCISSQRQNSHIPSRHVKTSRDRQSQKFQFFRCACGNSIYLVVNQLNLILYFFSRADISWMDFSSSC